MKGIFLPASLVGYIWRFHIKSVLAFLVMFVVLITKINAQSDKIDSLRNELNSDNADRPDLYMKLSESLAYYNVDSSFRYARLTEEYAKKNDDDLYFVRSQNALGGIFKAISMYDSAISYFMKGVEYARKNTDLSDPDISEYYLKLLNGLGLSYHFQGNYGKALDYHYESLNARMESPVHTTDGDSTLYYLNLAVSENNIGLVYNQIKFYDEAINFFNRAIKHKKLAGYGYEAQLLNLGLAYLGANKDPNDEYFNLALETMMEVLKSCQETNACMDNTMFEIYNNLGVLYLNADSVELARQNLEKALEYSEKEGDLGVRLYALHNIATLFEQTGKYSDAIELLNRGQKWTDSLNVPPLQAQNYKMLASVHRNAGNSSLAYDNLWKYDSLNSRIYSEDLISEIKNVLVAQNQRTNEEILSEKDKVIDKIERAQVYLTVIIILAFLILFIVVYNNRQRQKVNNKLSEANKTIEQKNLQLQDVNASLEEKVKERTKELKKAVEALKQSNMELDNFIYKTSHDIRGPLATLQGICNVALLDINDERAKDYLEKLSLTATKLNEILSKLLIINQINNSTISSRPILLNEVVQQIVLENANKISDKHIATRIDISGKITLKTDEDLIRIIIGNLVNNAFKYYKKSFSVNSFVEIRAIKNNINVIIEIIDNGIGINENVQNKVFEIFSKATEMSDSAGLGLYLVKLSVEKLKGQIDLKRSEEGFTRFLVTLPLNN